MGENGSTHDSPAHDTQRVLEQRALRNVRSLVDRLQADEEVRRRSQKWVVGLLVAIVAALVAVVVMIVNGKSGHTQEIVITPAVKAPAR